MADRSERGGNGGSGGNRDSRSRQSASSRKRTNLSVSVSAHSTKAVDDDSERWGLSKKEVTSRVLEWYGSQPELVRSVVLRLIPTELKTQAKEELRKALEKTAEGEGA